jgi:penicillin-binding protein 1A
MLELNYISKEDYEISSHAAITAKIHTQPIELSAPYIAEMARNIVFEKFGDSAYSSGLKVFTTLQPRLQKAATKALYYALHSYDERHGYRNHPIPNIDSHGDLSDFPIIGDTHPGVVHRINNNNISVILKDQPLIQLSWENIKWAKKYITNNRTGTALSSAASLLKIGDIIRLRQLENGNWRLAQIPEVEGAFVSLDPENGAILALTGGFDFQQSKYNRVTQSNRQPGSGFKPVIYTAALEAGYTAASIINDAPIVIDDSEQESEWRPENFSRKFFGPTRLRTALTKSRNLISIRLLRALGISKVTNLALRFGFRADQLPKSLTLALGSGQATPLQMAQLYAVFANKGFLITPFFIDRIESNSGEILFQTQPEIACSLCSKTQLLSEKYAPRIISPQIIFIMNSMLRDVVRRGTATRAKTLGRKDLAGKTGTTNEQRDAWFNGFNSTNVASAWVGFDNSKLLGARETGGKAALPMWIKFMSEALKDVPEDEFIPPVGIRQVLIDPDTGLLAPIENESGIYEYFRKEFVPTEFASTILDENAVEDNSVEELF